MNLSVKKNEDCYIVENELNKICGVFYKEEDAREFICGCQMLSMIYKKSRFCNMLFLKVENREDIERWSDEAD